MSNFLLDEDATTLNKESLLALQEEMQRLTCKMVVVSCVSSKKAQENTWVENMLYTQIEEAQSELVDMKKESSCPVTSRATEEGCY